MSRVQLETALARRGYRFDAETSTGWHLCYRSKEKIRKSRAVVFVRRDGSMVSCGPTLLTADPCPEFYNLLMKETQQ